MYTDGSATKGTENGGIDEVIRADDRELTGTNAPAGSSTSSYIAEMNSLNEAAKYIAWYCPGVNNTISGLGEIAQQTGILRRYVSPKNTHFQLRTSGHDALFGPLLCGWLSGGLSGPVFWRFGCRD